MGTITGYITGAGHIAIGRIGQTTARRCGAAAPRQTRCGRSPRSAARATTDGAVQWRFESFHFTDTELYRVLSSAGVHIVEQTKFDRSQVVLMRRRLVWHQTQVAFDGRRGCLNARCVASWSHAHQEPRHPRNDVGDRARPDGHERYVRPQRPRGEHRHHSRGTRRGDHAARYRRLLRHGPQRDAARRGAARTRPRPGPDQREVRWPA